MKDFGSINMLVIINVYINTIKSYLQPKDIFFINQLPWEWIGGFISFGIKTLRQPKPILIKHKIFV